MALKSYTGAERADYEAKGDNGQAAQRLANEIEAAIRSVFPGAFVQAQASRNLMWSIGVTFMLGASKAEFANGISHNDPGRHTFFIALNGDGTVPNQVKVELTSGGGILVKSANPHFAYDTIKGGWRNFTSSPAAVPAKFAAYFTKLRQVIQENMKRMGQESAALAAKRISGQ